MSKTATNKLLVVPASYLSNLSRDLALTFFAVGIRDEVHSKACRSYL